MLNTRQPMPPRTQDQLPGAAPRSRHRSPGPGGLLAIVCAVIGAKLATSATRRIDRAKALRDVYADIFAAYFTCTIDLSDENILRLVTAVERGMLICCEPSISLMREAIRVLAQDRPDLNTLSSIISKLRMSAKEDVRNAERK